MGCLGVLFALADKQSKKILSIKNDEELVEYIENDIEENWDDEFTCETDKAWDAIHRCFADGKLELLGGIAPLNSIIFGGTILNTESDYYVSYKDKRLVSEIAKHIQTIDKDKLKIMYDGIQLDYQGAKNSEDFEYTWSNFEDIIQFYICAAKAKRNVIFTVDQ